MTRLAPTQTSRRSKKTMGNDSIDTGIDPNTLTKIVVLDPDLLASWIRERQAHGIDRDDEVWEGAYVVSPIANNVHQELVGAFTAILYGLITQPGKGKVLPGANVSDQPLNWRWNFRGPDIVVVLNEGQAEDRKSHWFGGPDFLIEIKTPGDETEQKIPFYSKIGVRELLIVHRDLRALELFRHDGLELAFVEQSDAKHKGWIASEVVPLAWRWKTTPDGPRIEVKRTDGKRGSWTI
ncbi:MAG: Uma2 family endonuclease [Gemmataceae bacterium]